MSIRSPAGTSLVSAADFERNWWSYLSVSKVIQDGGQLSGVAVLTLGPKPRVGIPPVYGEPVEPHLSLVRVKPLQTGVKTVDLASRTGQGALQQPIVHSQPATRG